MISRCINALIFLITLYLFIHDTRSDGHFDKKKTRVIFRFFTEQSNVFCALAALALFLFPDTRWAWLL